MILYELSGTDDLRYSLYSWRARMALQHKGILPEFRAVALHDKPAIAFSGGSTVPILVDGDLTIRDSWAIARHLEEAFPENPYFGGELGMGLTSTLCSWVDRSVVPCVAPMISVDIKQRVSPADKEYFRQRFEQILGRSLEDAASTREKGRRALVRVLQPAEVTLSRQPFLCGNRQGYADYALFSVFQWARLLSPFKLLDDGSAVATWFAAMLALFDGYAGAHSAASPVTMEEKP